MRSRYLGFLLLFILPMLACTGQPLHEQFYQAYDAYKEPSITTLRFKHADIMPLVKNLEAPFEVSVAGQSVEGRDIMRVRLGNGPVKVLMWSQMHGNEPTATMALMDIFNFFQASGDGFDEYREDVLGKLSLYFIPMLNPDGAERFQRRNMQDIDLNRDAVRQQTPEARILKGVRDELEPEWGFNLHDQNRYYGAGNTGKQAGISVLAPAFNEEKDINEVRERSIRLIGNLNKVFQAYIPGHVGRYNDDFEPRAFGDNIQKWGTSTILIESGGLLDDPEKQRLRHIHFVALLDAFDAIANKRYESTSMEEYESIPMNNSGAYHDVILREVILENGDNGYKADISFRRFEIDYNNNSEYYYRGGITDIGDLSTQNAYQELPSGDYTVVVGKVYEKPLKNAEELQNLNILDLVKKGYTDFLIDNLPLDNRFHQLPVKLLRDYSPSSRQVQLGANPSLLLEKDGVFRYAVINGTLFDLNDSDNALSRQIEDLWR